MTGPHPKPHAKHAHAHTHTHAAVTPAWARPMETRAQLLELPQRQVRKLGRTEVRGDGERLEGPICMETNHTGCSLE